mgnify:CR=1 FL=1
MVQYLRPLKSVFTDVCSEFFQQIHVASVLIIVPAEDLSMCHGYIHIHRLLDSICLQCFGGNPDESGTGVILGTLHHDGSLVAHEVGGYVLAFRKHEQVFL